MTTFTSDWFTPAIPNWTKWLAPFVGQRVDAIEIGSYEGRSACWLLANVLTHPKALLRCVDTKILPVLEANLEKVASHRWQTFEGPSSDFWAPEGEFLPFTDIIYVDGSHRAKDVLSDAIHAWECLRPGGVLIFDDYPWGPADDPTATEWDRPGPAIDAFLSAYRDEFERLEEAPDSKNPGWQICVRKR